MRVSREKKMGGKGKRGTPEGSGGRREREREK